MPEVTQDPIYPWSPLVENRKTPFPVNQQAQGNNQIELHRHETNMQPLKKRENLLVCQTGCKWKTHFCGLLYRIGGIPCIIPYPIKCESNNIHAGTLEIRKPLLEIV